VQSSQELNKLVETAEEVARSKRDNQILRAAEAEVSSKKHALDGILYSMVHMCA
jgi:hypothetical protein